MSSAVSGTHEAAPQERRCGRAARSCGSATAVGLALSAFNENLVFFFSPSQIVAGEAPRRTRRFRVGGMVEARQRPARSRRTDRVISSSPTTTHRCRCVYTGILPDLFREGQGVVARARLGRRRHVSSPSRCWRSTTRTTCRRKWRKSLEDTAGIGTQRRARPCSIDGVGAA